MTQEEITRMLENHSADEISKIFQFLNNKAAEEAAIASGQSPEAMIKIYLDQLAEEKKDFANVYPNNPDGKTLEDCLLFIEEKAKDKCKDKTGFQCVTISSFDVFNWATIYFTSSDIKKVEKPKPTPAKTWKPTTQAPVKIDLDALLKEKEEWEIAHNERIDKWDKENKKAIEKFNAQHPMDLWGNKPENPFEKKTNPYTNEQFPKQSILDKALEKRDKKQTNEQQTDETASEPEPNPEAVGELDFKNEES